MPTPNCNGIVCSLVRARWALGGVGAGGLRTGHASRVTLTCSTQSPHVMRTGIADSLGVPESDRDAMTRIGVFVVEGMLTHAADAAGDRAVVETLVRSARGIAAVPATGSPRA